MEERGTVDIHARAARNCLLAPAAAPCRGAPARARRRSGCAGRATVACGAALERCTRGARPACSPLLLPAPSAAGSRALRGCASGGDPPPPLPERPERRSERGAARWWPLPRQRTSHKKHNSATSIWRALSPLPAARPAFARGRPQVEVRVDPWARGWPRRGARAGAGRCHGRSEASRRQRRRSSTCRARRSGRRRRRRRRLRGLGVMLEGLGVMLGGRKAAGRGDCRRRCRRTARCSSCAPRRPWASAWSGASSAHPKATRGSPRR